MCMCVAVLLMKNIYSGESSFLSTVIRRGRRQGRFDQPNVNLSQNYNIYSKTGSMILGEISGIELDV